MTKKIIITGGCGFIGHHVVEHFLKNTDWNIDILDRMTYASSGLDRIRDIDIFDADSKRTKFYAVDLTRELSEGILKECGDVEYILHMAAETHVDNSITDPMSFVYANVVGTGNILEFARKCKNLKSFIYFSTDEVFGPAPEGILYREWDRYNCTNPYSATKAGAEQLTLSYMNTFNLPGFIIRCMNVFGERQHPEKFIPMIIRKVRDNKVVTIHSNSEKTKSGSRFYIHARNVASAVHFLMGKYEQRQFYNIVGERELSNLELAQKIASLMGKALKYEMVDFHSSRPGHDLRYSLDGTKMEMMGWKVPVTIDQSLQKVVEWTLKNEKWLYI
jgi:dTDP-glucose 4,6-dehydratase